MMAKRKLKICAICMTVSAFCLFGSSVLHIANGKAGGAVSYLLATAFNVTGAFLAWRSYCRLGC